MTELLPYIRKVGLFDIPVYRNLTDQGFGSCSGNCERIIDDSLYKYHLEINRFLGTYTILISIQLNDQVGATISKLIQLKLNKFYTEDSIKNTFSNYPVIQSIIINGKYFEDFTGDVYCHYGYTLSKQTKTKSKDYYLEYIEYYDVIRLSYLARKLTKEIIGLKIDFSQLIKKNYDDQQKESQIPKWLVTAIAVGGVFAIKFAIKSVIRNADFDFDFDIGNNDADCSPTIDLDSEVLSFPDFTDSMGGDFISDDNGSSVFNPSFGKSPDNSIINGFKWVPEESVHGVDVYEDFSTWAPITLHNDSYGNPSFVSVGSNEYTLYKAKARDIANGYTHYAFIGNKIVHFSL